MAQEIINVGTAPNDGLGDPIRTAYIKCNTNFGELYSRAQTNPPDSLVGSVGDTAGMYAYNSNYFYYCFADYDGTNQIWNQVSEIGNVSITQIVNGTSKVAVTDIDGNIAVDVDTVSNVVVISTTGLQSVANVTAANINATTGVYGTILTSSQDYITSVGELTSLTILGNTTASNINATLISATSNVTGGNLITSGRVVSTGNVSGGNITTTGTISTAGNVISQGSISAVGDITTTGSFIGTFQGNITGNFVVPGSNTQVLFNTSGNADAVAGFTFDKDSNLLTILGNVSSANLIASSNISGGNVLISGISSITGNLTGGNLLTTGLVSATGTITSSANIVGGNLTTAGRVNATSSITGGNLLTGGNVSATGNVTSGNVLTSGIVSASGNITGGNILTAGLISATGNITAGNIFSTTYSTTGNVTANNINANSVYASLLDSTGNLHVSNTIESDGNINAFLNVVAQGNVSAVGNVNGGSFNAGGKIIAVSSITGGSFTTAATVSATGNVTGGNLLTGGLISATGNITGGNVLGGANVNATTHTGTTVSVTGNVNGGNLISGALIQGTTVSASGNITGGNVITGGVVSSTGNIVTVGTITVNSGSNPTAIVNGNSNGAGNIGSASKYFNTVFATATTALYADLAEKYLTDANYDSGTVMCFGGPTEITQCNIADSNIVAGVVSTRPAYVMNNGLEGEHVVTLALLGRVPCKVYGPVTRGAMLVSAGNGHAQASSSPAIGTVIGKSLEDFAGAEGIIEIIVGRL